MLPEPSGEEYGTALYIHELLTGLGLPARLVVDGRGVVVDSDAADPKQPRVLLRADIDALRIQDAKCLDYRSQRPNLMHACGHDGHTAGLIGAVLGLWTGASELPWAVSWRAIFQPAEETGRGALEMTAAGVLDNVGAAFAAHMDPSRPVGRVGIRYGVFTAACDELTFTVEGRGGHAARPHESLDPIATAAQLIQSLYLFVPRASDSLDPVVVTIGQILAGDNPNVIPERAVLRGTLRTLTAGSRERTKEQIRQLVRGIGEAAGTRITLQIEPGPPSVKNDAAMTEVLREAAAGVLGWGNLDLIERPSMGGEDFAHYLEHVPGAMFRLGCAPPGKQAPPLHSPLFDIDERAITIGAQVLARSAVLWADPDRLQPPTG